MLLALLLCVAAAIDCCRGGSVVFCFNGCVCVKAALIERCQCLLLLLLLKSVKVFAVVWQIDGEAWCCFASVCFVAHGTSESLSLSVV